MQRYLVLICLLSVDIAYSQQVVYPLHVGDRWEYDTHREIIVLGDTLFSNNKHYTKYADSIFPLPWFTRQDSNKVYYFYSDSIDKEIVRFDFGRNPGDTLVKIPWQAYPGLFERLTIFRKSFEDTIFGKVWKIYSFRTTFYDYFFEDNLVADSLGVIYIAEGCLYTCPPVFHMVIGAEVGGKKYGTLVGIDNKDIVAPIIFSLSQNYHNPFNQTTTISFGISEKSFVTLKVYDVLGREVAAIVDQELAPASYTKAFDGSRLSSGVYVCRLTASYDNQISVLSRKLMLVK